MLEDQCRCIVMAFSGHDACVVNAPPHQRFTLGNESLLGPRPAPGKASFTAAMFNSHRAYSPDLYDRQYRRQ
jgi:hypothetical protein